MESKEKVRSSVFAKTMRFNGISQQPLHHAKSRAFDFGFKVVPTKELCRVYLHKIELLASKGIIDALAKPVHSQRYGEKPKQRTFGRRFDQQNLNLKPKKLRHCTNVEKKESSPRRFSPLGFGSDSQLRDRSRKGQYMITPEKKKPKEMSSGSTTTLVQKKEAGSKLIVSTSRDSVLSLERKRFAQDVKFRHVSSPSGSISKDESEEDPSDCSTASLGCQTEEAHQPSPVSVLEPIFNDDVLEEDSDELPYLDLHGIEKQLDYLKSESDSYSEGSGMEVSSDEESVIGSETEESKESETIMLLDSQEIRESSYIDDILSEVSLMNKSLVPDKLDSVLTFKVFEKMEKKYYTETSWKRSERRIFFDRVSSGLVEILESYTVTPTWKKPVSRRICTELSTCGLKQELCKVLAKQEKGAKKVSSNKVPVIDLDEWFKPEDDDDESLVCELESMIVDDLLFEVVSFIM
ncbi:Phosphatidylinositol N-acetyglucosaminlytransferase subunit P-like protein [Hirschfeldia incana]|nr:Phosphatidylinositol N-acetyglucosaminlytransferase subunit P-like protein [Hirschfeldia incana]KAJ0262365.1 Phosphatidylinositol N-acetyglucosaminlytransferase subunit P-like protein [Hirschfeldia incana]